MQHLLSNAQTVMRIYIKAIFILLFIQSSSCRPKVLSKEQLLSYLNRNSALNKSLFVNDIKVDLKYYPSELLAIQEFESSKKSEKTLN
jgi:hypothetical protein